MPLSGLNPMFQGVPPDQGGDSFGGPTGLTGISMQVNPLTGQLEAVPATGGGGGGGGGLQKLLAGMGLAGSAAAGGGGSVAPGFIPGSLAGAGPGLQTGVNPLDFLRFLPGFGATPPADFASLFGLAAQNPLAGLPGGGGGGAGGGGGGGGGGGLFDAQNSPDAQGGAVGGAQQLLAALFGGGPSAIDQGLQGQINQLLGQSAAGFGQFTQQVGGGLDPIMALILAELGGQNNPQNLYGGGGFASGGGGGNAGLGLKIPDISLKGISPEAQALIDQMTGANVGALQLQRQEDQGKLLADLFGRGVQRSSIAGDAGGRLLYGADQLLAQARAAGADQTLQAMLADQAARTQLGQAQLQAQATLGAAGAGAGASAAAAQAGFQADMNRARMGLLGDIFGSRSSALASAFGSQQGANTGFAGILGDIGLGQLGADTSRGQQALGLIDSQNSLLAALRQAQAGVQSSRIGANAQLGSARINQQTQLAGLPFQQQLQAAQFQQSEAARLQQGILSLLGIDLDRYLGNTAAQAQIESARLGRPSQASFFDKLLGVGGLLGSAYLGRG